MDPLDALLSAYKAHPDLDALIPLEVGHPAGHHDRPSPTKSSESDHSSSFEREIDAALNDLHSVPSSPMSLPDHSHGTSVHPSLVHQQSPHVGSSRDSPSRWLHSNDRQSPDVPLQASSLVSSHASETSTNTQQEVVETQRRHHYGARQQHLGSAAKSVTRRLANFHNIDYNQARYLLNRRLNKEKADLLKDPDAEVFAKGAKMLSFNHKYLNTVRRNREAAGSPAGQHQGSVQAASDNGAAGSGTSRKRRGKPTATAKDDAIPAEGPAKKLKGPVTKGPVALKNQEERDRMSKHAETIIPAEAIRVMVGVYRDYTGSYPSTAQNYVRKAISQDPGQAHRLAADMLSGQEGRMKAAVDRVGHPPRPVSSDSSAQALALPEDVAGKVVQHVALHRKVNREHAIRIVKSGLTPEIALQLQDPSQYRAAVDKILFRKKYAGGPGQSR